MPALALAVQISKNEMRSGKHQKWEFLNSGIKILKSYSWSRALQPSQASGSIKTCCRQPALHTCGWKLQRSRWMRRGMRWSLQCSWLERSLSSVTSSKVQWASRHNGHLKKNNSSFWTSLTGAWQAAAVNWKDVRPEQDLRVEFTGELKQLKQQTNMCTEKLWVRLVYREETWERVSVHREAQRYSISRSNTNKSSVPSDWTESKLR